MPAYVLARGIEVGTARGRLAVDVSYGGAIYASLPAAAAGLAVEPEHLDALIALGREIKWALDDAEVARHPSDERLSGIYGTILYDDLGETHQRNVAVFADGEVDRSPCGSGTSARAALLAADGRLPEGAVLRHESIVGTEFRAQVVEQVTAEGRDAVVTEVEGTRPPDRRAPLRPRPTTIPLGEGVRDLAAPSAPAFHDAAAIARLAAARSGRRRARGGAARRARPGGRPAADERVRGAAASCS